jgi:uncharacterized membrane protein (UPF0127 family)
MSFELEYFYVRKAKASETLYCSYSSSPLFRMKGLLGRKFLNPNDGIWLKPCNNIHMFFMQFPIDAVFLNSEYRILNILEKFQPWKISPFYWHAKSVLEIQAERSTSLQWKPGDQLVFEKITNPHSKA